MGDHSISRPGLVGEHRNNIQVVDSTKSRKIFTVAKQPPPDEQDTLRVLSNAEKFCRRISSTHASSLGLHPAVYFYSSTMRHQPTAVLAMAKLVMDLQDGDGLLNFTTRRRKFEDFLASHKMHINQLTSRHGSMAKGFLPIKNYYQFVLNLVGDGKTEEEIESALKDDTRYQTLVKEKPARTKSLSGKIILDYKVFGA